MTLVYRPTVTTGQTVGRMKLGMQVGLGPDHTVMDGMQLLAERGTAAPHWKFTGAGFACIRTMSIVAKWLDGSR